MFVDTGLRFLRELQLCTLIHWFPGRGQLADAPAFQVASQRYTKCQNVVSLWVFETSGILGLISCMTLCRN